MSESLFIELTGTTGQVTLSSPIALSATSMVLSQVSILLTQATDTAIANRVSELIVRSPVFSGVQPQVIQTVSDAGVVAYNHAINGITLPVDPSGAANSTYFVARNPHKIVPFVANVPQSFPISVTLPNGEPVSSLAGANLVYCMLWFNYDSL